MNHRPTTCERFLRYNFSEPEILTLSRDLSNTIANRSQKEADKKRAVKEFDAAIAAAESDIELKSEKVRSGYELRTITCRIEYHQPKVGFKTVIRSDTGETTEVAQMNALEMQEPLPLDDPEPKAGEVIDAEIPDKSEKPDARETFAKEAEYLADQDAPGPDEDVLVSLLWDGHKSMTFRRSVKKADLPTLKEALKRTDSELRRGILEKELESRGE